MFYPMVKDPRIPYPRITFQKDGTAESKLLEMLIRLIQEMILDMKLEQKD